MNNDLNGFSIKVADFFFLMYFIYITIILHRYILSYYTRVTHWYRTYPYVTEILPNYIVIYAGHKWL